MHGATQSFTLTPDAGYAIGVVGGSCPAGSLSGSTYTTGAITAPCTVEASFSQLSYTVSPSAGSGGSISPNTPISIGYGVYLTFNASADPGFRLAEFSGSCGGSRLGSSFTTEPVTQNCTVVANFMGSGTVAPSAPTITLGELSATSVQINFSPNDEGSDPIISYGANCEVPSSEPPQRWTQTTSGNSLTLSSLPSGTEFSCFGWATNIAGDSAPSNAITFSTAEMPAAPLAPNILKIDFGDGEIYLYVSSSSDGGSAITGYTASCTDGTNTFTGASTSSPITVSGLTNDVAYTCTVTATNSVGTSSASSATDPITPEATSTGLPIWLLYQATQ